MLTINEILKNNYKKVNVDEQKDSYEVHAFDKITDKFLYRIPVAPKSEWDLNFAIIRLLEEESLNDMQCEHLLTRIEDYGQQKYNEGSYNTMDEMNEKD